MRSRFVGWGVFLALCCSALIPTTSASADVPTSSTDGTEDSFPWNPDYPTYQASNLHASDVDAVCNLGFLTGGEEEMAQGGDFDSFTSADPSMQDEYSVAGTRHPNPDQTAVLRCNGRIPQGHEINQQWFSLYVDNPGESDGTLYSFFVYRDGLAPMGPLAADPDRTSATGLVSSYDYESAVTGDCSGGWCPMSWSHYFDVSRLDRTYPSACPSVSALVGNVWSTCGNEFDFRIALQSAIYNTTIRVHPSFAIYWHPRIYSCGNDSCSSRTGLRFAFESVVGGDVGYPDVYPSGGYRPDQPVESQEGYDGCEIENIRVYDDTVGSVPYEGPGFPTKFQAPLFFYESSHDYAIRVWAPECSGVFLQVGATGGTNNSQLADGSFVSGIDFDGLEGSGAFDVSASAIGAPGSDPVQTVYVSRSGDDENPDVVVDGSVSLAALELCYDSQTSDGWLDALNPYNWLLATVCIVEELVVPQDPVDVHLSRISTAAEGRAPFSWIRELVRAGQQFGQGIQVSSGCSPDLIEGFGIIPNLPNGLCGPDAPTALVFVKNFIRLIVWLGAAAAVARMAPWRSS